MSATRRACARRNRARRRRSDAGIGRRQAPGCARAPRTLAGTITSGGRAALFSTEREASRHEASRHRADRAERNRVSAGNGQVAGGPGGLSYSGVRLWVLPLFVGVVGFALVHPFDARINSWA